MSRDDLCNMLLAKRGAFPATIASDTAPKLITPSVNPYRGVRKVALTNGMLGWDYGTSVNNQRLREGQPVDENDVIEFFEPLPRTWGERVVQGDRLTPLVEHEGKRYLELKVGKSLGRRYFLEGVEVPEAEVLPWLQPPRESARQRVDKKVICRDYAVDNVTAITLDGQHFDLTP